MRYASILSEVADVPENWLRAFAVRHPMDCRKFATTRNGSMMYRVDAVLKAIADALRTCGTEGSLVARWGGEEFLMVFQGLNGDEARVILEDLRSHIEKMTIPVGDAGIHVTMTFGLTEYDFSGNTEPTIKEADEKLYLGKTSGRNRVVY